MKQMKILQKLQLITKQMKTQNNLIIHKIVQTMKIKLKKFIIQQLIMKQIMIQLLQILMIKD
jgi:hypothetical protein